MNSWGFALLSALASGVLFAISNVGIGVWQFAFLCFVPLVLSLERAPLSLFRALILGFLMGLMAYSLGYSWLLSLPENGVIPDQGIALYLWLVHGLFIAMHFALLTALYWTGRRLELGIPFALLMAVLIVEAFQLSVFPFHLGASLIHVPILAQLADVSGVFGLSVAIAAINGLLVSALLGFEVQNNRAALNILGIGGITASLYFYGLYHERLEQEELILQAPEQALKIGLVQSNLVEENRIATSREYRDHHIQLSAPMLEKVDLDLLVWPAKVGDLVVDKSLPIAGEQVQGNLDVPLIFSSIRFDERDGHALTLSSTFLVNERGLVEDVYDKTVLLPLAEYFPNSLGGHLDHDKIKQWLPLSKQLDASNDHSGLYLKSRAISPPINEEVALPELVRQLVVSSRAQLLLASSNEHWFHGSRLSKISLALTRLRAIELRRWVVRVTNGGISAVISPTGRITSSIPSGESAARAVRVLWRSDQGLYLLAGNWLLPVGFLLACVLIAIKKSRVS